MQTLIEQSALLPEHLKTRMSEDRDDDKVAVLEYPTENPLISEMAGRIQRLWSDPGIQRTYENRAMFHLDDGTAYLFNRIAEIAKPDYIPNNEDFLRVVQLDKPFMRAFLNPIFRSEFVQQESQRHISIFMGVLSECDNKLGSDVIILTMISG